MSGIRRLAAVTSSCLAIVALVVSCSESSTPNDDAGDSAGTFPVTIEHVEGDTVIESEPTRIASVGIGDVDVLLALGLQPVLAAVWPGSTDSGVGEWSQPLITGQAPTALPDGTGDFSLEAVLAAEPDLILAVNNAIDQSRYQQLDAIAPTVLHDAAHEDWVLPWQEVTTRIGTAVGKEGEAEQLVAETENLITSTAADNADLDGLTAALVVLREDGNVRVFSEESARGQLVSALGMNLPAELAARFDNNALFVDLAPENLAALDVDVLVVDNFVRHRENLEAIPTYNALTAVRAGNVVKLDEVTSDAVSMPNPVTIPFVLERFVEQIRQTPAGAQQ